jgi:MoaA/NifB/PqqE/SkfB family radical SAM enzyme
MGGEPLVRKGFLTDLTRYAADKGFFVYLPTNGTLLDKTFIDQIGEAGVSTINLAVDALKRRPGLPKAFERIKPQFEYLVEREKEYGYITFININITPENLDDVIKLTEIAHDHGIATDYHINEAPLIHYDGFEPEENSGWNHKETHEKVDKVIDWLIEKNQQGYTMANSINHLHAMKPFIRQELPPWDCKAGILSMIIRIDGTFAPCFELYGSNESWGSIYDGQHFDPLKLAERKKDCSPHCLSTCNYQVKHYSGSIRYSLQWLTKHAYSHFLGVS